MTNQAANNEESRLLEWDDPLLRQLPEELREYVKLPSQNQEKIEYVHREGFAATAHAALSMLLCCYSGCRMVVVKQGELCLTQNSDKPEMLGPGRHVLLSPFNSFIGIQQVTEPVIRHGPLHIIRVEMGQLGYGVDMKSGRPVILARGKHIINDIHFKWKKFITLRKEKTKLDQLSIIRIETGYIGYAFKRGNLEILKPGLHMIEPPDRFGEIISTMNQLIDLEEAVHETSDYVPVAIKAAVFFRIVKAERALRRINNIHQQITETAVATLAGIIRASSLSDIASRSQTKTPFFNQSQGKNLTAKENASIVPSKDDVQQNTQKSSDNLKPQSSANAEPSAPPFFQHVHDEFIQQLHDYVLEDWGIDIQNIRIESLKISDRELQKTISNQAIDVSRQHNKYLMLQKQSEIVMVEAQSKAEKNRIDTEAESSQIRSEAQAEGDAVVIAARAEKEAMELKGQGEAEFARLLESTALGKEMSVMQIQADTIKNLKQVAYVPHLPEFLGGGIFSANAASGKQRK